MKKYQIDTSSWKAEYLKFEFNLLNLRPAKVEIKINELKSDKFGQYILPKTKHKGTPYLPVIVTFEGGETNRFCFAGKQAYDLPDNLDFETNSTHLISYMEIRNGKILAIDAFEP